MAKRRNVSGRVLRNAVPQPRDVAEFVAPRTVNEGLSIKNVFGDVGDMIDPFITAAIEKQEGLRDVSDDELKMLAALGSIPVAGAVAGKLTKKLNKLVPNPKGGFLNLKSGQNKLKDVMEASNAAGQIVTPEIEKEVRDHIGIWNKTQRQPSKANVKQMTRHYDEASPEAKQIIDGFLAQTQPHTPKPAGFDSWTPQERIEYLSNQTPVGFDDVAEKAKSLHKENYGNHLDYGVISPDYISSDDFLKAKLDLEAEQKAAEEAARAAEAAQPIEMTQVQDMSTGILPGQSSISRGGTRPTYDHSRQFMDTELKQVPGIDRTGMSYGDDTDAFYDIYKAWRDADYKFDPKMSERVGYDINGSWALQNLRDEARNLKKRSKGTIKGTDPYYAAGIVGDENKRLWDKIEDLRSKGKSDAEIREILSNDLNKYQGSIERFKERMPSKKHGVSFEYDGATTSSLKATPSEEARALRALGIDTKEYEDLEKLGNFYRVFFPE